jgi:hypothetical protein
MRQFDKIWPDFEAREIIVKFICLSADRAGVAFHKMFEHQKNSNLVHARQWVWYEASREGCTGPQIANVMGFDPSTVSEGIKNERWRRNREGVPVFHSIRGKKPDPVVSGRIRL